MRSVIGVATLPVGRAKSSYSTGRFSSTAAPPWATLQFPIEMAGRVSVLAVEDHHAPMLAEFFRLTWNANATAEDVQASRITVAQQNSSEPGIAPPTFIAVQDDKVIGYCSSLPLKLWSGHEVHAAYWAKGLMVLPEFRGGPIGFHVLSALSKSRPLMAAVTVAEGSKRLFGALGFRDHGAIPNLIRHTRLRLALGQLRPLQLSASGLPKRLVLGAAETLRRTGLATVGGTVADGLTAPFWGARPSRGAELSVQPVVERDALDALWLELRGSLGGHPVRDYESWSHQYLGEREAPYHFVCLWRNGSLKGVSVLKTPRAKGDPRLAGLRMASISDLLVRPDDPDLGALLAATERHAAALGAGSVILSVSNRRVVEQARRRGYLERSGNIHFFLRATNQAVTWPTTLGEWWLTRGDGESDATF